MTLLAAAHTTGVLLSASGAGALLLAMIGLRLSFHLAYSAHPVLFKTRTK